MSKPEDIPQDVWNTGAKMAGEYFAWLNAGNSRGNLSEHAVAAMADTIARAILAAEAEEREACARLADAQAVEPDPDEQDPYDDYEMGCRGTARRLAAAIRKRGEG